MAEDNDEIKRKTAINKLNQDAIAQLKEEAKLRQQMSGDLKGYLDNMTKIKAINKTVIANRKLEAKLIKEGTKLSGDDKIANEAKVAILQQQTAELEKQGKILVNAIKDVNKGNLIMAKSFATSVKAIAGLPNIFKSTVQEIRNLGLFDMDKATKKAALSMGLLGDEAKVFASSIDKVAEDTTSIGIGVAQLAKMQAEYSDNLGRNVMLTNKGAKAMAELASATGLGEEGSAKMAADMENQGYSAERTGEFVAQTMNDTHAMGLNASKVIKNISNNMKLLNKYNFKGGVKGLEKMAQTVSKLGVDMNFVGSMADKLFDIEGAVDMSAQLQVLGGAWAKLADPFHLMYMARNDMAGLTKEVGEAAAASAHFNKESHAFEISSLEMARLRKVAEQTGVSYEDLATAAKNAAKFTEIKKQVKFNIDDKTKEFLTNTAQLNEKGEASIMIKGSSKLLKELSDDDIRYLKAKVDEQKTLKERAEAARTFDEQLKNTVDMFKTALLPLLTSLNEKLMPKIDGLVKKIKDGKWLDKIEEFAGKIGDLISTVGGFIVDNPIKSLILAVGGIGLMEATKWVLNGMALGKGFNMVAGAGGSGGIVKGLSSLLGSSTGGIGGMGKGLKGVGGLVGRGAGTGAAIAGGLGIGGAVLGGVTDTYTDPGSAMNVLGKAAADGMTGAAIGAFLGPIGMAIGGAIGAAYGGITAYNSKPQEEQNDAFIGSPIHDGKFGNIKSELGNDFSKGRAIVQGGSITPIDNKDDLMAYKPNGIVDNAIKNNIPNTMKIEFGNLHISFDELKVSSPSGDKTVSDSLLKDPKFLRDITRMVHIETSKAIEGGKVKP